MGLGDGDANGVNGLDLGINKNRYKRMDSDFAEEDEAVMSHQDGGMRQHSTRKYVFACAIFASLNSVLLGY
ncbi:hypothetical protein CRG98_039496, partial [Punica granatum]